jgi:hypothetical protein
VTPPREAVILSPETERAALNIAAALGTTAADAERRALRIEADLARYRAFSARQALRTFLSAPDPLTAGDWEWLQSGERGPLLLALPLTLPALAIVARLFDDGRRFLCIEETGLTAGVLRFVTELHRGKRAMLVRAPQQVRHRKTAPSPERERTIYVTFPDHHKTTEGTSRIVSFLGGEHYLPVTEPLLYFRGVTPVVTLLPGTDGRLILDRYEAPVSDPVTEDDATALLVWLARSIESFARAGTHELLAWGAMSQRTCDSVRLTRAVHARMLEAFLRAWKSDDGAIAEDVYVWSVGELERIHAANRTRAKGLA